MSVIDYIRKISSPVSNFQFHSTYYQKFQTKGKQHTSNLRDPARQMEIPVSSFFLVPSIENKKSQEFTLKKE